MKKSKRLLAAILTVLMLLTLLPTAVLAVEMQAGTPAFTVNSSTVGFGGKEWYVIGDGSTGVNPVSGHLTLLAKSSFGNSAFRIGQSTDPGDGSLTYYSGDGRYYAGSFTDPSDYNDSTLMNAMATATNAIPAKEAALITARSLTSASDGIGGAAATNQSLWPLSLAEHGTMGTISGDAFSGFFWLRSPQTGLIVPVVNPGGGGGGLANSVDASYQNVRPAFNLNLSSVLFTSATSGANTKASATVGGGLVAATVPTGAVKLTVLDDAMLPPALNLTDASNGTGTLRFNYSNAVTGTNQYVSCVLEKGGAVEYYGKLADCAIDGSGTLTIPLTDITNGSYTLKIFCEQANGDNYTDFVGVSTEIELNVSGGRGTVGAFTGGMLVWDRTTNHGRIVVGGTTQVAMADFDTIKPNTGDIYFGNLVEFGYLNGAGAFAGHSDYSAIKNQKGFRRDDACIDTILTTGPVSTDMANRAVYDLMTDKGITNWLTIGEGTVYAEGSGGSAPGDAPTAAKDKSVGGTEYPPSSGKYYWEAEAGTRFFDSKEEFMTTNDAHTAIFIPAGNPDIYLPDSGTLNSSIYSIRGYQNSTEGDIPAVDTTAVLTKEGFSSLTMSGDCSWYNGVFNLGFSGAANTANKIIFAEAGALFGGVVNLWENTTLEWHGGVKDPYNRPTITMTGATLDLVPIPSGGVDVFTFNGVLKGDAASTVRVGSGTVTLDGDISAFLGSFVFDVSALDVGTHPVMTGTAVPGLAASIRFSGQKPGHVYSARVSAGILEIFVAPAPPSPAPQPTSPAPQPTHWENPFDDVSENDWFYNDVKYVHQNGLFAGTSAKTFSPQMPMTRGMVVTVLGRLAGIDIADYSGGSFDDVDAMQYYAP